MKKLYRTDYNKMISGVCNGLAEHFNADVSIIRLIAVIGAIITFSTFILVYIAAALILPKKMY